MPDDNPFAPALKTLGSELDRRTRQHNINDAYYTGTCRIPKAIIDAELVTAYERLMPLSQAAWGSLVVDSVLDRLEVSGIKDTDDSAAQKAWGLWQDNFMDSESKLAHNAALIDGRVFALVWPEDGTGPAEISLDDCTQMVVQYQEGSRRKRRRAMRRWIDDDEVPHAVLYLPDEIHHFSGPKQHSSDSTTVQWKHEPDKMVSNPLGVVPVVEIAVNRRLKPGTFPYAVGEYENHLGVIDRINLLTFIGLVVAIWMGFPLRGVIGPKVLKDDNDNPIAPFESKPDSVVQIEGEGKVFQFEAADRKNLSIFPELSEFAMLTKTPRHYFPQDGGISNVAADTVRAEEGALHAKVTGHKASTGEGWEETLRLGGMMGEGDAKFALSSRAEMEWKDHEFRSMAERADAASKLKDILPPMAVAEYALNVSAETIRRWEADAGTSAMGQLIAATREPSNGVPAG